MKRNALKLFLLLVLILLSGFTAVLIRNDYLQTNIPKITSFLSPIQYETKQVLSAVTIVEPSAVPTLIRTATSPAATHSVEFVYAPSDITEGAVATFTWNILGPPDVINTSTVYFGTTSNPGVLTTSASPADTPYTTAVPDFISGTYNIPMTFVGNVKITVPGTYYARVYTLVGGKHYWSGEKTFVVNAIPVNQIAVKEFPKEVNVGANTSFTWEITGPVATTGFTAIVGSKTSAPGPLGISISLQQTSYSVLTQDFVSGKYDIPLRFIGNTIFKEAGTYYFRALTFINNKNIWSEEYSLIVK